ncbi:hypothetical protein M0P65_05175 [Candidatus Gracilibacteria bacterium]|nr:hypothetical protein [Candidatus Gracilibacteria bacterium]
MDIKGITLGKALRLRKTIANKIALARTRALTFGVTLSTQKIDFNTVKEIQLFDEEQTNLRDLKIKTAWKSLNTKVFVPKDIPVAEAGKSVSIFLAVLIRDDLKARKQLNDSVVALPTMVYDHEILEEGLIPTRDRNFNFDAMVAFSEKLQEAIDTMDGIIQGIDAVTIFE